MMTMTKNVFCLCHIFVLVILPCICHNSTVSCMCLHSYSIYNTWIIHTVPLKISDQKFLLWYGNCIIMKGPLQNTPKRLLNSDHWL